MGEKLLDIFYSYYGGLSCVCWSPDGKYIVTGGQDDMLSIFSMSDSALVARARPRVLASSCRVRPMAMRRAQLSLWQRWGGRETMPLGLQRRHVAQASRSLHATAPLSHGSHGHVGYIRFGADSSQS